MRITRYPKCNQEQNTSETSSLGPRPLKRFRYVVISRDIGHQKDQTTFPDLSLWWMIINKKYRSAKHPHHTRKLPTPIQTYRTFLKNFFLFITNFENYTRARSILWVTSGPWPKFRREAMMIYSSCIATKPCWQRPEMCKKPECFQHLKTHYLSYSNEEQCSYRGNNHHQATRRSYHQKFMNETWKPKWLHTLSTNLSSSSSSSLPFNFNAEW